MLASSVMLEQSTTKLIKLTKKKNTVSNISIKIISNNGHSSLVGLSAIILYSTGGQIIKITEEHLKGNYKLMKLFTEASEGWTGNLSGAVIKLDKIVEAIGGIRIVNFNKSELQNSKQADLVEIMINEQLHWRGQLKTGSFKENQNYITDVKVTAKEFQFPIYGSHNANTFQKRESECATGNFKLREEGKGEKKEEKEVSWLEKESLSKLKEIQELEKNQSKTRKIHSIRNTVASSPYEGYQTVEPENEAVPDLYKNQQNFSNFKKK